MESINIYIGDQVIITEGDVVVTYSDGCISTYKCAEISVLYLSPGKIVNVQVKREIIKS